ncbi:hypothetical protein PHYBLDRAFT_140974 [Phycomyces blakesleeanus NRRL 1555(-)]|uniref:Uncharacterized protein n=1 Tax=Phycomyces blakesleeanus (strain ATCC 8743b / DSM 1359 / FGSC 10004 / NBRC 33097 / NRRL 1555) TaxID=763407 RepID=A0A167Q1V2_PHYB8|nr:hypothetical protein PHYBLDRAFT_140974 [Phycomyces blakesleeanus NRRL 1555(-)]OAD78917.1 hypothetical protein PHYBLDRAFT_140974 [Phycomyces blakesleeanus NRRL 1555(-)]|eukprot:XP_018296957.1 hypothetical protein PHYBLDRAFT_140974 [Phycomyces blakesleeanus NRRL 1555(-)]
MRSNGCTLVSLRTAETLVYTQTFPVQCLMSRDVHSLGISNVRMWHAYSHYLSVPKNVLTVALSKIHPSRAVLQWERLTAPEI